MELNQQEENIKKFLKEAWCIDGEVTFVHETSEPLDVFDPEAKVLNGVLWKLTDSKRGTFYIAILT